MNFLRKKFAPWTAADCFDTDEAFLNYLRFYNRVCNTLRVILFAAAFVLLMIGYAGSSTQPYYAICVGTLVIALGLSLLIAKNEKLLPEEEKK